MYYRMQRIIIIFFIDLNIYRVKRNIILYFKVNTLKIIQFSNRNVTLFQKYIGFLFQNFHFIRSLEDSAMLFASTLIQHRECTAEIVR